MGKIDAWLRKADPRRGNGGGRAAKAGCQSQGQTRRRLRRPSQLGFVADHSASASTSMLQSTLTLYGMLTLMLGIVIPISDALAKPVEHADYRQIFYIVMHGIGAVSIVYLNALIAYHKSDPRAAHAAAMGVQLASVPEALNEISTPTETPIGHHESSEIEFATQVVQLHGADGGRDCEGGGGTRDLQGAGRRLAHAEVLLPLCSEAASQELAAAAADSMTSTEAPASSQVGQRPIAESAECWRLTEGLRRRFKVARRSMEKRIENLKKKRDGTKITWSAAGVNIYLRLGAIIFGFGVMVHDGFKIVDVLEKPGSAQCAGPWFLPKQIVHLVFIVCQTYHLFKHHRVTINTQTSLVRFILVHLMVTNLCIWGKTVIYEIKLSLMHSAGSVSTHDSNGSKYNTTGHHPNVTTTCSTQLLEDDSPSHKLGPYLYPCAVEYGLISAAICYKLFTRVGDTEAVPFGRKESPLGPRATTCHKSHKGLFLGLFIMICVLVPTISLIFLRRADSTKHRDQHALAVIAVECLVLVTTAAMAVLGTAKAVRRLRLYKLHGSEAFDVNLLFVGLSGVVCYNLFVSISVGACLMDTDENDGHCQWGSQSQFGIARLTGLKSLLEVTQSVAQTLFVMQAIQRKVTLQLAEGLHKPGRGVTIALLIANLAMWVASVFETQRDIADHFLFNYFGSMPWSIIKYIFLPLIIFYRFHSTVCLSEIWIQSYKVPKKLHLTHP